MPRALSFFIAGTMQGSSSGITFVDQGYRQEMRQIILRYHPNSVIHCPLIIMQQRFFETRESLYKLHAKLAEVEAIIPADTPPILQETFGAFHDLLRLAADSDVLVAYLPNHEASMGTAMEMLQAHQNHKPVITISGMRQNLAILATSTTIIPDFVHFESLLASGWLQSLGIK
jgi:hypothetical protein